MPARRGGTLVFLPFTRRNIFIYLQLLRNDLI